jgi:capsular polysaccharide transport system permease protein
MNETVQNAVRPPAGPARVRLRHLGLVLSFLLIVLVPVTVLCIYLWAIAEDRYGSLTGFTVRQEESGGATELLGGLIGLPGSNLSSDSNILYEFILSQTLVQEIEDKVGLRAHYSAYWSTDPAFALWPEASIEDLEWYWRRVVRISYDQNSGLIELRVLAYTPQKAREIAAEIVRQSQDMINELNVQAREDAMRYAQSDLGEAVSRLKTSREALTTFRTRTQIVDPEADIQGRMGVINNLQQQLAEALISSDILGRNNTTSGDPRKVQAELEIQVIRERIAKERESFASETASSAPGGEDYPRLIAEYEGLVVDREFAEESYRAALTALDIARAQASRQSRYLATYIRPTLAETSEFPQRFTIAGVVGLILLLAWSVMALVYYSIRDRS